VNKAWQSERSGTRCASGLVAGSFRHNTGRIGSAVEVIGSHLLGRGNPGWDESWSASCG